MKKVFYTNGFNPELSGEQLAASKKLLGMMWAVNEISGYGSFMWDYKKISIFELYQQHPDCVAILITQDSVPAKHCEMFMEEHPEVKVIYVHDNRSMMKDSLTKVNFKHEIDLSKVPHMVENRHMFGTPQKYLKSEFVVFADTLSKQQVDWLNTIGGLVNLRVYGRRPNHRLDNYCGILLNSEMKDCMASVKNVIMFEPSLAPTVRSMGLKAIVFPNDFDTLEKLVGVVKSIKNDISIDLPSVENLDQTSSDSYQNYVMQTII
jgi:hypothetical protein